MTDPLTLSPRAFVSLVGAGPGDPGLLTLRARDALERAEVVLTDALADTALLAHCPQARVIDTGKRGFLPSTPQEEINALLIAEALAGGGQRVVRLKGGDPFVFGRGGEEALALQAAGIPFEVVPGVSSAVAAAAYAGIPVTHRGVSRNFAVLTGTDRHGPAAYQELGGIDTLVFLMGMRHLPRITADLMAAGRGAETPAAAVQWASTPQQRTVLGTLGTLAAQVEAASLGAPAVIVVGAAAALAEKLAWYSPQPPQLPMSGARVAVTRTRPAGHSHSRLAAMLRRRGAQVSEVQLLHYAPTPNPQVAAERLQGYSGWLALTSEHAAHALRDALQAGGADLRALAGAKIAAVGGGTARTLRAMGLEPDLVPSLSGARHLAAELPLQPGERVLHPDTLEGDPSLRAALEAQGLGCDLLETYRCTPAQLSPAEREALDTAHVVTLASAVGARALAATAGTGYRTAIIGPQTAGAAAQAGFSGWTLATEAGLPGLADAAERSYQTWKAAEEKYLEVNL